MKTKICSKCKGKPKPLGEFYNNKSRKDGVESYCKVCSREVTDRYHKTKKGIISIIYSTEKRNSKHRKHPIPNYSKQELENWLMSQSLFHELYNNWVKSGYNKNLKPSIDRKNDKLPYTLDNIQLTTWAEHITKTGKDHKNGTMTYDQKPVTRTNIKTGEVKEFISIHAAARSIGKHVSRISLCCIGKKIKNSRGYYCTPISAYGFYWKFTGGNANDGETTG